MRILFLLTAILFVNALFGQTKIESKKYGTLEFVELDYGLAQVKEGKIEKLKGSPSRTHGWLKDFEIVDVTDSIEIEPKANFGVMYLVKAKDSVDINVDIEWIYPETIKNEQGKKFKSIRYTTKRPTNTPSASSYSLDEHYELVKGNWEMNIYIENKKVYTKTFILY